MEVARQWRGSCEDCAHWNWNENSQSSNGEVIGPHCGLFSCNCATAILNHKPVPPPRFLSWKEE